ncbi:hypothetical protein DACRYDRAFT_25021 [Dacryopinax primogenitus]|uniref:N-acetyl-D-glucosamine kinase n=1 Tax=Dacryopinax primogenitus (strain DJM 731) TaxID=1858805 RepID=M5FWA0_DACPD|nr:uncharacterized protein DACRYDRAFT_25021 [Dacryopinax primogenitus]EJT97661.1 hypothetical protein DACRYDRAFT_25021 [Dacryopinax primogenitus]
MSPPPPLPPLHLCIDGGGTKTSCAIASSLGILARGFAGTSNIAEVGLQNSVSALKLATERAIAGLPKEYLEREAWDELERVNEKGEGHISRKSIGSEDGHGSGHHPNGLKVSTNDVGLTALSTPPRTPSPPKTPDPADTLHLNPLGDLTSHSLWVVERPQAPAVSRCPVSFDSVWVGLAGVDAPSDALALSVPLSEFFDIPYGKRLVIQNDAALLAAPILTNGSTGGLTVVAGTGSVCLAWAVEGGQLKYVGRRGGTGFLLGDEGSAFYIGRAALRAVVDDFDSGAPETQLHEMVRVKFGVKTTDGLLAKVYELDEEKSASVAANQRKLAIAELSRAVVKCATEYNCERAKGVLRESARDLAWQARPLVDGRRITAAQATLCMGGGMMGLPIYREMFFEELAKCGVRFAKTEYIADAAGRGARALAGLDD